MNEQFSARLKELRGHFRLSQQEFGDMCGLSQKTVSNLEKGRDAKALYLELMERAFPQVRPSWLRSGIGAMLAPAPTAAPVPASDVYSADLVAQAQNVLLREQLIEQREMILWLRGELGKSPGSPVATATPATPTDPANPILRVQRRGAQPAAIGFKLGRR